MLTPLNYELFEFNKIVFVYFWTIVILCAWAGKMIASGKFIFKRTFWDKPLLVFFASQAISTIISIDRHTSIFGYYSRFNGGLLSTACYLLLYWALTSNIGSNKKADPTNQSKVIVFLKMILFSGFLVSAYGIAEHFGIDKNIWVQDVQNRVFSTLGQPNWLAAYLNIIIFLSLGVIFGQNRAPRTDPEGIPSGHRDTSDCPIGASIPYQKTNSSTGTSSFRSPACQQAGFSEGGHTPWSSWYQDKIFKNRLVTYFLFSVFYLCLLFTKSRSGFLGFILPFLGFVFLTAIPAVKKKALGQINSMIVVLAITFFISVIAGTPFNLKWSELKSKISFSFLSDVPISAPAEKTAIEGESPDNGLLITPSSDIRKIVWKGAVRLWRQYPVFGTGTETFGYAYYWVRPIEHNLTSEWDFLYNKAHNEYLNFAANNGTVGLLAYLALPFSFLFWLSKRLKNNTRSESPRAKSKDETPHRKPRKELPFVPTLKREAFWCWGKKNFFLLQNRQFDLAIASGFFSVMITNFFGFSVTAISLLFFLLPAIIAVLNQKPSKGENFRLEKVSLIFEKLAARKNGGKRPFVVKAILPALNFLILLFLIYKIACYWIADFHFAKGESFAQMGFLDSALTELNLAVKFNPSEPVFYSKRSVVLSKIVADLSRSEENSGAKQFIGQAIEDSAKSLSISPYHINFYKERAKMLYYLAFYDLDYINLAIETLTVAAQIAPTDAKIPYNIASAYQVLDNDQEAKKYFEKSLELKPNYLEAKEALARLEK